MKSNSMYQLIFLHPHPGSVFQVKAMNTISAFIRLLCGKSVLQLLPTEFSPSFFTEHLY